MENLVQEFRGDLEEFKDMTDKFYAKEVSLKDYKGFSGGFGSYAQRGGEASMLRLRLPGGRVTKEQLEFIVRSIEKHQITKAHFTTCQTIQLHNLSPAMVYDIMEHAMDVGIITRGGGGDFPRNVMVSPLSGVEQGEYFNVLPYAQAVGIYLLGTIKTVHMPRKLKVGFSNSPTNETHATFRDLGFVARENGNFDVYSAGGLGNNPKMGVCVAEDIAPSEVMYYVKAMIDTFVAYGNYEVRAKARTRYMQDTLGGSEGYKKAYLEKLENVKKDEELNQYITNTWNKDVQKAKVEYSKTGLEREFADRRVIAQKQPGLYAVSYHPLGGVPEVSWFRKILDVVQDMEQVELRIAPDETVYIINLNGNEVEPVLMATADGAKNVFETSVSCIGSTICQVGLRDSQGTLRSIIEEVRKYDFADGVLPQIHISGCMSSCGTHQIGTIGFHGGSKKVGDVVEPAFMMHVNGSDNEGQERFGEQWGIVLQRDLPRLFVEIGQAVTESGKDFDTWFHENPERLKEIAQKYF